MGNVKSFYEKHTLLTPERINTVQLLPKSSEQPAFIHQASVNGRNVAFLGKKPLSETDLEGKFIKTNQIVLPEGARMLDSDKLRLKIQNAQSNGSSTPYAMDESDFLGKPLSESVLVDACTDLGSADYANLHFHRCHNYDKHEYTAAQLGFYSFVSTGFGTCPGPWLQLSTSDEGELKRDILAFYISKKDIEAADKNIVDTYNKHNEENKLKEGTPVIQGLLHHYFNIPFTEGDEKDAYIANFDIDKLEGVFLIPTIFSDQRVVYHCIPNVELSSRKSDERNKNTLPDWLEILKKPLLEGEDLVISGNDDHYIYVEEWSIFLSKNASLIKVDTKEALYHPNVLQNKV